ncbi:homoserine kinase [Candidatus Marithioploca araucensis]|uniref:Homoserine kinase n=1 Tax=Candidatus Marithioploca araucensis TaxID=70273 RepID=A0ABT7VRU3_9GAMM|nr:homoserine kinase [Candidatus Marithioploca araucensis]
MSVYTLVERHQLEDFLRHYNLGDLVAYQGICAGIENTNYFVTTSVGEFVLTLFEYLGDEELPYFLELMAYLAEHDIPSAHPLADNEWHYLRQLNGKPAALVKRLRGKDVEEPNLVQCHAVGYSLGRLHTVSKDFSYHRPNERGPHWWKITAKRVLPFMDADDALLLKAELDFQANYQNITLPTGVIHADLFRDNALFEGDTLSGIIDLYYACNDVFIYDIAITVNDWCRLPNARLDEKRVQALFDGYLENRPLTPLEYDTWPVILRAAALRFWLSRLQDQHFPRPGEITHIKEPAVFRNLLKTHIEKTSKITDNST